MKKLLNKSFVLGFVVGALVTLLGIFSLYRPQQKQPSIIFDTYYNKADTIYEISPEELQNMMKGVQGDLTAKEYHNLEERCYFENLYEYAKMWNIIDSTMTFEDFLKHPLCDKDSLVL